MMEDFASVRDALQRRLAELEGRAGRIEADLAEPLSADFEEQATEREDDETLEGQDIMIGQSISTIRAALARIDDGSYGQCTRCDKPVDAKRLQAIPEAALCIKCATELEIR